MSSSSRRTSWCARRADGQNAGWEPLADAPSPRSARPQDIKSLLDLSCAKVASMIKNKTVRRDASPCRLRGERGIVSNQTATPRPAQKQPEDIRKTFNIKNDFTPEEEAQVREENKVRVPCWPARRQGSARRRKHRDFHSRPAHRARVPRPVPVSPSLQWCEES